MTMLDLPFDDAADGADDSGSKRAGQWRLARIELANWGTFSGLVTIDVARKGHLFTGASGSGKSSLLDAVAAVLTPNRWLRLNAAAQDGSSRQSDRTLMSYVRGAWTKEADETADRAVTTYLRPRATWSGVLLRYENLRDEPVVLARVFHAPGTRTEPSVLKDARVFTRGELDLLALARHVEGGIDARKMTAALPDALITTGDRHGRFHERVVKQFGFRSDTTLQLLHKTQSAKNLGTLDALFRGFMLDQPKTFSRADNAVEQFTELERAHAHVVDLRRQAEALGRVDEAIVAYDLASADVAVAQQLHDAVEPYTARVKLTLAREACGPRRAEVARAESARHEAERERRLAGESLETARARVRDEGGSRVELLQERVDAAEQGERVVADERGRIAAALARIGAPLPEDAAQFAELVGIAAAEAEREITAVPHDVRDAASQARRALADINTQLLSLRDHRSNLDPRLLTARRMLAEAVGLPPAALPFAAELLSVLPAFAPWRGAIERVLGPLATTLLVRDEALEDVRRAAERRHLGVRLVIEAVPLDGTEPRRPREPRSAVHRIEVKEGPFAPFLRRRLVGEYDYACVDHPDELDGVDRGVTIAGLVKRSARRYEKDDRSDIDDPARWVLGGDIEARLEALLAERRAAEQELERAAAADRRADDDREEALARREVFRQVAASAWERIDIAAAAAVTAARRAELHALTSASSSLRDAQESLERAVARASDAEAAYDSAHTAEGVSRDALSRLEAQVVELEAAPQADVDESASQALETRFRAERRSLTVETVDAVARTVQATLSKEQTTATHAASDAQVRFADRVAQFRAAWPTVAADLTVEIGDRYAYRDLRDGILARGLPEKEGEFRRLLRERSRDVVAHLQSDLRDAPGQIRERILPVNVSLGRSPFDGTDQFLEIDVKTTRSPEVNEFLDDLRRIVEGNWADESASGAELRFAVLQRVIGRLGSKDRTDLDWRTRVLDTRLHVSFLAREKDAKGRVLRVYNSAEGLSGGQRQKLVIFCLAAALRYQLTDEDTAMPQFGSIMLDEAFDKADSTYTRNAMDVFRTFGFHMILATPQKLLQTLEPYVGAITSVSNPERRASKLANVVFTDDESADTKGAAITGDHLAASHPS